MKRKKTAAIGFLALALFCTGCSGIGGGGTKTEETSEKVTAESAETASGTETEKRTDKVTEGATKTTAGNKAEAEEGLGYLETAAGTKTSEAAQPAPGKETEVSPAAQPQTEAQDQWSGAPQSPQVYEEEMMQCPYCAHWFSTLPDDDLWNPYDRHMLEERETDAAAGQTEVDMVQCPDCGNWYETGNVFRNHICAGRQ